MNDDSVLRIVAQCRLEATTKCVAIALALMVTPGTHKTSGASLSRIMIYAGLSKPTVIAKLGKLIQDGAVQRLEDGATSPPREGTDYALQVRWFKERTIEASEAGGGGKAALLEHPSSKVALLVKTLETAETGTFTSKATLLNTRSSKATLLVKVPGKRKTRVSTSKAALPEHLSSKAALLAPAASDVLEAEPPPNAPARHHAPASAISHSEHRGSSGAYCAPGVVGTQDTGACDRAILGDGHEHCAPYPAPGTKQGVGALHPGTSVHDQGSKKQRGGDQEKGSIDQERSTASARAIPAAPIQEPGQAPMVEVQEPQPAPSIADALGQKSLQIAPGDAKPPAEAAGTKQPPTQPSSKTDPGQGQFLATGPNAIARLAILSEAAGGALTWIGTNRYPPIGNVSKEPKPQILSAFVSRLETTRPAENVLRCMGTVIKNKRCWPLSQWKETAVDLSRIINDDTWQRIYNEALAMIAQRLRAIGAKEGEPQRPWHPSGLALDDSEIRAAFFRKTLDPKDWPGWDRLKT